MLTVRPIRAADAPALAELLSAPRAAASREATRIGQASVVSAQRLPEQPALRPARAADVQTLIAESHAALAGDGPVPHRFVLVLEDQATGLLGAVTLAGSTGLDLPRASYRTGTVVHASAELKMFHRAPTLLLGNDLSGCAELGRPLMAAADDAQALQRLLVDAALMFVAGHPDRFAPTLVAELPGIGGAHGASPFWQGLGRHFHPGTLPQDSPFFPSPERSHIARLMPKHPLYSALLGPDAQACIGRHAASAQALAEALHAQGLRHRGQVNLFDAGPVLEAEVADLTAVRQSRRCRVVVGDAEVAPGAAAPRHRVGACLLAVASAAAVADWRVGLASGDMDESAIVLTPERAATLGLQAGQEVRVLAQARPG